MCTDEHKAQLADPRSAHSTDPRSANSADPRCGGAAATDRSGGLAGRRASHEAASPSPRCRFEWLELHLQKLISEMANDGAAPFSEFEHTTALIRSTYWVAKATVRHVIGRGGRMLQRLEDTFGAFISIRDCSDDPSCAQLEICGPPRSCALVKFAVECFESRHFSILDSLLRIGF